MGVGSREMKLNENLNHCRFSSSNSRFCSIWFLHWFFRLLLSCYFYLSVRFIWHCNQSRRWWRHSIQTHKITNNEDDDDDNRNHHHNNNNKNSVRRGENGDNETFNWIWSNSRWVDSIQVRLHKMNEYCAAKTITCRSACTLNTYNENNYKHVLRTILSTGKKIEKMKRFNYWLLERVVLFFATFARVRTGGKKSFSEHSQR